MSYFSKMAAKMHHFRVKGLLERRSEGVTEWCGRDIEECVRESTP